MSDITADTFYRLLYTKEPVSLVRCGDGEKIVLDGFRNPGKFNAVLKRQLGFSPAIEEAEAIRANLIEAINNCDILGVPRHKNLDNLSGDWQDVEKTINIYCNPPAKRCSLDIHYDFLEGGYFDKLIPNQEHLAYISCRELDKGFRKMGVKYPSIYAIAPEAKFTTYIGPPHYPDQFNKVERWMDKVGAENKLLLVGAGFIGKIYCNWWRDRGGKAFDIGSVFDEWAGMVTRGPDRGLDNFNPSKYYINGD